MSEFLSWQDERDQQTQSGYSLLFSFLYKLPFVQPCLKEPLLLLRTLCWGAFCSTALLHSHLQAGWHSVEGDNLCLPQQSHHISLSFAFHTPCFDFPPLNNNFVALYNLLLGISASFMNIVWMNGALQQACEVQLGKSHYRCFMQEQDRRLKLGKIRLWISSLNCESTIS